MILHLWQDLSEMLLEAPRLGGSDILPGRNSVSIERRERDLVKVDEAEAPNARPQEQMGGMGADALRTVELEILYSRIQQRSPSLQGPQPRQMHLRSSVAALRRRIGRFV